MIKTLGIIAFQWVEEAGIYNSIEYALYQFQKPSEEKRNKECIGKNQCPNDYSPVTDFDPCHCIYLTGNDHLISVHLFFLIFESFLYNLNNSNTNNNKYKNQKKINRGQILYHHNRSNSLSWSNKQQVLCQIEDNFITLWN